jgi:hypothetical protein
MRTLAYSRLIAVIRGARCPTTRRACVAERALPEDFDGVLGWGWVDNRPFLRCLHGLTLSAWRLELYEEAEELCWALLWLNPGDHLGAAELLAKIVARQSWTGRR